MTEFLLILTIYTVSYAVRHLSGPFGIFDRARRWLLAGKLTGVFTFELLSCPWCVGFHCGYVTYLCFGNNIDIASVVQWGLIGSVVVAAADQLFELISTAIIFLNKP